LAELDEKERMQWAKKGINSFSPEVGVQVLGQLLKYSPTQIVVSPVNWDLFKQSIATEGERLFFSRVGNSNDTDSNEPNLNEKEFKKLLLQSTPAKQHSLIIDLIREEARHILGFDSISSIKPQDVLQELGFDSLMSVQLRNALSNKMDINLPTTLLFDYPSVDAMATYIIGQIIPEDTSDFSAEHQETQTEIFPENDDIELSTSDLANMSDEDVEELLKEELRKKA